MRSTLSPSQLKLLSEFLTALNAWRLTAGIDVCAYGGIDIEVGDANIVHIEWSETVGTYALAERP